MNSESCNQMCTDDLIKTDVIEANSDLFNINFDKHSLNIESSDSLLNALTAVEGGSGLADFDSINESSVPQETNLGQDVVMTNEGKLVSETNIVQSPSNFITTASLSRTVELPSIKSNVSTVNKTGTTQLLIFPKQSNLQNMLVGAKTLPVASASNVAAIVQSSPGVSSGTKILTLPSLNTSGNVINTMSSAQPGKLNDVKILLSQGSNSGSFITAKPIVTAGGNAANQVFQGPLKRAVTPSSNNQMVTKVIITNSANSGASIVSPVPVSAASSSASATGQPQSILLASPNKTLTLSRNLVSLGGSQQILRTVPGTPTKQFVISPVKPAQKVAYAPVTYSKSPRRIAPATSVTISNINAVPKIATVLCPTTMAPVTATTKIIPQSPTKVILKSIPQTLLKPLVSVNNSSNASTTVVSSTSVLQTVQATQPVTSGTTHSLQVPGNKFHYVRLVSANNTNQTLKIIKDPPTPQISSIVSLNTATASTSLAQVRPTVPIAPAKLITPKQVGPKFLIPAVSSSQIRGGTSSVSSSQLGQLPAGTLIPVGAGSSSYVMVPAQYVTQLQQPVATPSTGSTVLNILPAPPTSSSSALGPQSTIISITSNPPNNFHSSNVASSMHGSPPHSSRRATPVETDIRPRKPCNCTKSQCLKLYCDCFANGEFCNSCNCTNCYNNLSHEEERQKAIKACLDRNPYAFHPKIGKSRGGGGNSDQERRHTKGCNCKRSYCLKNYCECYEAKILCTNLCKCVGCKNFEDSSERKTLMHLADAAEVRVQQQAAAKTNLSSQILDIPTKPPVMSQTGERLPFAFVTDGVLEATCLCLLAQASEAEKSHTSEEEIERLVLQEFGRCLVRIIDCANKTKVSKMDVQ
ncbi:protein lin-54 homolog isoform X2 [Parasteatoda tepidariorum]|nr:protein lin-54 homolog isoform X2 [Parasteatoda tepidariorum]XP_015930275.1 protein lin-54 homolog isoform X2 [Parasteatoda tepidariorum]XP_042912848.1 protein lin-54 homolog isoform X2 [Parasteatoda tepidariorum]